MTAEFIHNPFQPPESHDVAVVATGRLGSPNRFKWCMSIVVSTMLISLALLASGETFLGYPLGMSVTVLCGSVLILMSVVAGERFAFKTALVLTQLLNLLTWPTMFATVFLALPFTRGETLRVNEIQAFIWIWLVAAFLIVPISGIGWLLRMTRSDSPLPPTAIADKTS